ncbi:MAG: hypothetical protein Q9163_000734 [Psora crenata]
MPFGTTLPDYLNTQQPINGPASDTEHEIHCTRLPKLLSDKTAHGGPRDKPPGRPVRQKTPGDPQRPVILHLFRSLLRQCTYLPDPAARKYLRRHVTSRFRNTRRRNSLLTHSVRNSHPQQTAPSLVKAARKALLYLYRANAGHPQHLGKILEMTYGRIGKRRHELLEVLKTPFNKNLAGQGEDNAKYPPFRPKRDVSDVTPQFTLLMRSQSKRKETLFSRQPMKQLRPVIPEKNIWGRPMPLKRVRNIKKRWYAEALHRTMPPLPLEQWERLRRLASGEERWEGPVPRRKGGSGEDEVGGRSYLTDRGMSRPHTITPRFMRRLWGKILAQCPALKEDEKKSHLWRVLWANVQKERDVGMRPATRGCMDMFAGVNENGKVSR